MWVNGVIQLTSLSLHLTINYIKAKNMSHLLNTTSPVSRVPQLTQSGHSINISWMNEQILSKILGSWVESTLKCRASAGAADPCFDHRNRAQSPRGNIAQGGQRLMCASSCPGKACTTYLEPEPGDSKSAGGTRAKGVCKITVVKSAANQEMMELKQRYDNRLRRWLT